MNIDKMTCGELKQVANLFTSTKDSPQNIAAPFIGEYCIARCYAAGVHAGTVREVDNENVILENSRRVWGWKAQDGIALSGVARYGITKNESKLDVEVETIYLTGVCELIPCTTVAEESINEA